MELDRQVLTGSMNKDGVQVLSLKASEATDLQGYEPVSSGAQRESDKVTSL